MRQDMAQHADREIDIWEPSLKLAKGNIADEGLQDRITLRRQNVTELDDDKAFDFAFVPSMFFPIELLDHAVARVIQALVPGGFLVLGMFARGRAARRSGTRPAYHPMRWPSVVPEEIGRRVRLAGLQDLEFINSGSAIASCSGAGNRSIRKFLTFLMSPVGTKRTCASAPQMSAFGSKSDIVYCAANVCY